MPDGTFVEALADLAKKAQSPEILEVDGVKYVSRKVIDPREPDPRPSTLGVHTLSSLVEYVRSNLDKLNIGEHMIHVLTPTLVEVISVLRGRFRQRETLLMATHEPPINGGRGFQLCAFHDVEWFIVGLMTNFVPSPARNKVLSLVGNMKEEAVRTVNDDGHTQEVTARKGLNLRLGVSLPNPVHLVARRTFPEIEQPEAAFILRAKGGGDDKLPQVALFDAAYVATYTDRRLFISDAGNARILSVKLDYHTTERVALKDVRDERP